MELVCFIHYIPIWSEHKLPQRRNMIEISFRFTPNEFISDKRLGLPLESENNEDHGLLLFSLSLFKLMKLFSHCRLGKIWEKNSFF